MQKILYGTANLVLFIAGVANLFIGTWSAWTGGSTIAIASLTAGLVLIFAATVDRFESIKGLGIEAKTKKLDEKIEQADKALEKLKELAELTCGALIELSSRSGRLSGPPTARTSIELAAKTRSIMSSLGSDTAIIKATLRPWVEITCLDRVRPIRSELSQLMDREIKTLRDQRSKFPTPVNAGNGQFQDLTKKIAGLETLQNAIHQKFNQLTADDFPEKFIEILDDAYVEVGSDEVRACKDKGVQIAHDLRELRATHQIVNTEHWIAALDSANQ